MDPLGVVDTLAGEAACSHTRPERWSLHLACLCKVEEEKLVTGELAQGRVGEQGIRSIESDLVSVRPESGMKATVVGDVLSLCLHAVDALRLI